MSQTMNVLFVPLKMQGIFLGSDETETTDASSITNIQAICLSTFRRSSELTKFDHSLARLYMRGIVH